MSDIILKLYVHWQVAPSLWLQPLCQRMVDHRVHMTLTLSVPLYLRLSWCFTSYTIITIIIIVIIIIIIQAS